MKRLAALLLTACISTAGAVNSAAGSMIVNIAAMGNGAVSLQWFGAALLYTALMLRNMQG